MNAFYEHHKDSIKFRYRCFDRILLNGSIQSFLDGAPSERILLDVSPHLSCKAQGLAGCGE